MIGKCPILDTDCEVIETLKVDEPYHIIAQNEYYVHIKTESGLDCIYKRKTTKRRDLFRP